MFAHSSTQVAALALLLVPAAPLGAQQLPATRFEIDRLHSQVEFVIGYLGLSHVRGRFTGFNGAIMYDDADPAKSTVSMVVPIEGLNTDVEFRDKHLKSPDFFDAPQFPLSTFRSTSVRSAGGELLVGGPLALHGVTRDVVFRLRQTLRRTPATGGFRGERIAFEGGVTISRKDFGIEGGTKFNPGHVMSEYGLSDSVRLELVMVGQTFDLASFPFVQGGPKPMVGDTLDRIAAASGGAAAWQAYQDLKVRAPDAFNFHERQFPLLAAKLAARKQYDTAIAFLGLITLTGPSAAAVQETIGDYYLANNDHTRAVQSYDRALALDPTSASAQEMLRWLRK